MKAKLEVHEHWYLSGVLGRRLVHSHAGGNLPHRHAGTGPAKFTIDKDEWFRATGLRGGGRKKFTPLPSGEQLPIRELEDWQRSFEIIVAEPSPSSDSKHGASKGPGISPAVRMILGFGMTATVR